METTLKFDRKRTRVKYCPCGKSNRDGKFVPYQLHETKGYCHSCDKTFLPNDGTLTDHDSLSRTFKPSKPIRPSYHSHELQDRIITEYENQTNDCNLTQFLLTVFSLDEVQRVTQSYYLTGTNRPWQNSTVFWQIDERERIHGAKIMLYSPSNGKRVKEPYSHINWLHNVMKLPDYNLNQCLFGLHLTMERPKDTIGIVESEKTTIMMSALVPELIWMATGSKNNLKPEMMAPLKGRDVVLFPDKGEYQLWSEKAGELKKEGHRIAVGDMLEGTEYGRGFDLADYYLKKIEFSDSVKKEGKLN